MKTVEKLAHYRLVVQNFHIDALNYNCQETWVLESVVFILHFSLGYKLKFKFHELKHLLNEKRFL